MKNRHHIRYVYAMITYFQKCAQNEHRKIRPTLQPHMLLRLQQVAQGAGLVVVRPDVQGGP